MRYGCYVGKFPFTGIALKHAFKHSQNIFFGEQFFLHALGPNEQFDIHGILSCGSKVGQSRSQGTCNMMLLAGFQQFFLIFPPPK